MSKPTPLLISTKSAAHLLGIAPRSAEKCLTQMGLKPVLAVGSSVKKHLRWSRKEIFAAVNQWSAKSKQENAPVVIDAGRTRAPRNPLMKSIIGKGDQ